MLRGKWVLENLLGAPPPPPPPNVPPLKENDGKQQADVAARADGAASHQPGLRVVPRARWIRWGSRSRTSTPTGRWRDKEHGVADRPVERADRRHEDREPADVPRRCSCSTANEFVRHGHREAAHLRAGPRRRVLRPADGSAARAGRRRATTTAGRRSCSASSTASRFRCGASPAPTAPEPAPREPSRDGRLQEKTPCSSRRRICRGARSCAVSARRWRCRCSTAWCPALTALAQDRRRAGPPLRRLLRPERHGDGLLAAEGRRAAAASCRRRFESLKPFKDQVLLIGGLGDEAANLVRGRRRPRPLGRHVPDLRALQDHVGANVYRRNDDGSDRGEAVRQGDAARVARARASSRRRCSAPATAARAAPTRTRSRGASPTTPLPMENDPRSVFERLFGDQRQHRSGGAAGAHQAGPQHPRLRHRARSPGSTAASGPGDQLEVRRVPRFGARRRAPDPEGRGAELARAAGRRSADGHPDRLRGARQADDGSAGARLPDRPDARQHVHAGARGQQPRLSRDRRLRFAPSAVAPPERGGQARTAAQDQRVPLPAVRASGREAGEDPRGRRARCSTTRSSSTAPASATATRTSTTTCRSRSSAARRAGITGGRYIRYPAGDAAGEPARHAARQARRFTSTSSATAPANSRTSSTPACRTCEPRPPPAGIFVFSLGSPGPDPNPFVTDSGC